LRPSFSVGGPHSQACQIVSGNLNREKFAFFVDADPLFVEDLHFFAGRALRGGQRPSKSLAFCKRTSRLTPEMALVSGIRLGQTSTQFCAKPHS